MAYQLFEMRLLTRTLEGKELNTCIDTLTLKYRVRLLVLGDYAHTKSSSSRCVPYQINLLSIYNKLSSFLRLSLLFQIVYIDIFMI